MGVGVGANAFKKHGGIAKSVEINPVVALYAKQYLGIDFNVDVEDALSFVAKSSDKTLDEVVPNVLTRDTMSFGLLSDAMFKALLE